MLYIIFNPASKSGYGKKKYEILKSELNTHHLVYESFPTDKKYGAKKCVKTVIERIHRDNKPDPVIAVLGGDGTMNEVLDALPKDEAIAIAYLPTGSSNDLARSLKITADPVEFIKNYRSGIRKTTDYGLLTNEDKKIFPARAFSVSCGLGLDAAVCKETNASKVKNILNKVRLGKLSYVTIALKQIFTAKLTSCDITLADGSTHHFDRVLFIVTMIQPYEGGGIMMAPMADGTDGLFDIMVVAGLHRWQALYLLPLAFGGKHINAKCVHFFKTEKAEIKTADALTGHVDGEYAGELKHVTLECVKNSVQYI